MTRPVRLPRRGPLGWVRRWALRYAARVWARQESAYQEAQVRRLGFDTVEAFERDRLRRVADTLLDEETERALDVLWSARARRDRPTGWTEPGGYL